MLNSRHTAKASISFCGIFYFRLVYFRLVYLIFGECPWLGLWLRQSREDAAVQYCALGLDILKIGPRNAASARASGSSNERPPGKIRLQTMQLRSLALLASSKTRDFESMALLSYAIWHSFTTT